MKNILFSIASFVCFSAFSQQISALYDHEGADFEFRAKSMVTTSDSIYAVASEGGANNLGYFFRTDENGTLEIIHSFDSDASDPLSIAGNEAVIYGTTRSSSSGSGKLFKYSLDTYEFEFLHEFSNTEGQDIRLKYVTDTLIWGYANESSEDFGSVFTIGLDGTGFTKIYNNTNATLGQNPADISIADGYIFIACYNGGGIPYDDGSGSTSLSGSIIRVDIDGSNYLNIVEGSDTNGTQPESLTIINNELYYLFGGKGLSPGGVYGKVNFDGTNNESLGSFNNPGRGKMFVDGDILHIMTSEELHGFKVTDGVSALLESFSTEIGRDAIAGPLKYGDSFIISVQQGGTNGGGGLLAWKNEFPVYTESLNTILQEGFGSTQILPKQFFEDDEGISSVTFQAVSGSVGVNYDESEEALNIVEQGLGITNASITVTDTDLAQLTVDFTIEVNAQPELTTTIENQIYQSGFTTISIDLSDYFQDRNGDEISYDAVSSAGDVIGVSITDNTLTISEVNLGDATVTIEATDGKSDPVEAVFDVKVNGAPEIINVIEDVLVNEGFATYEIDLTSYISDPNSDDLSYDLTIADETVVTASTSDNLLTVTEVGIGESSIEILIDDSNGGSTTTSFVFVVNGLPEPVSSIEFIQSRPGFESTEIDFNGLFSDPDGDPLSYEVEVSNSSLLSASVTDGVVTITELAEGFASVSLTVSDDRGGSITVSIFDLVLGTDFSDEFEIYPNPATTYLSISHENLVKVDIIGLDGIIHQTVLNPKSRINIAELESGVYVIRIETHERIKYSRFIKN